MCETVQSLDFPFDVRNEEQSDLGYSVGDMERVSITTFDYYPSVDVETWSSDADDP